MKKLFLFSLLLVGSQLCKAQTELSLHFFDSTGTHIITWNINNSIDTVSHNVLKSCHHFILLETDDNGITDTSRMSSASLYGEGFPGSKQVVPWKLDWATSSFIRQCKGRKVILIVDFTSIDGRKKKVTFSFYCQ